MELSQTPSVVLVNTNLRIGSHIAKMPSLYKTFSRFITAPHRVYQLYVSNSRSWQPATLDDLDDAAAARIWLRMNGKWACIHASLLFNLCGSTDPVNDKTFALKRHNVVNGLRAELDIGVALDVGAVVHIGSCKDKKRGKREIALVLKEVLTHRS